MDEPHIHAARKVIEHMKLCGYVITPPDATQPHKT